MTIFNIFTLMGGLALFLFGMQVMAGGLQRVAGTRLEQILERLTSTPVKGVLLGAGVTAVIQSSSATTVMVVGFVNAGIMHLKQSVGIIMGANLGTTATAWILSLTGIDGTSLIAQLCKPTSFSPILGFVGIILYLLCKNDKLKDLGSILLGFMALMYGMTLMSDAVSPLANSPGFAGLLVKFSNPILGLLAGAVLTAILQSSSASVGILQAVALTGVLPFASAVPIIMGQNIGTCVTSLISSIGTSPNAKRAAFIHFYFNVLGTAIFMVLFYLAYLLFPFDFMTSNINVAQIAIVHTTFNVVATACLLPLSNLLVTLATKTVKEKGEAEEAVPDVYIPEERFLTTPGFAVEQCRKMVADMAKEVKCNVLDTVIINLNFTEELYDKMLGRERIINQYESTLSDYILKLNQTDISAKDATSITHFLNVAGYLEHISDHAVNVANTAKDIVDSGESFSKAGAAEMAVFNNAVVDILGRALRVSTHFDFELAKTVHPLEEVIDTMRDEMRHRHILRLQNGDCSVKMGIHLMDILNDMERMSDYGANIAAYVLHARDESFDIHRYYKTLSPEDRQKYRETLEEFRREYVLPGELRSVNQIENA